LKLLGQGRVICATEPNIKASVVTGKQ